jgi:hypothetical protein
MFQQTYLIQFFFRNFHIEVFDKFIIVLLRIYTSHYMYYRFSILQSMYGRAMYMYIYLHIFSMYSLLNNFIRKYYIFLNKTNCLNLFLRERRECTLPSLFFFCRIMQCVAHFL